MRSWRAGGRWVRVARGRGVDCGRRRAGRHPRERARGASRASRVGVGVVRVVFVMMLKSMD